MDDIEQLQSSNDEYAMMGHKTADSSFFGYKTHIAMLEERIITAATITTGEKNDGRELEELYHKSKARNKKCKFCPYKDGCYKDGAKSKIKVVFTRNK